MSQGYKTYCYNATSMNQLEMETRLSSLPLGGIRYFDRIASTNDEAADWIKDGCPDLGLVIADEQTSGRGRGGRKWFTPAGSALAFSLVLHSKNQLQKSQNTTRLNGLGALAVCQTLMENYTLPAQIKWPNDILVGGKKLSGVLAEAHWIGNELMAVVLGIGINVAPSSIPPDDWDTLNSSPFPATSVELALGKSLDRWDLLFDVLAQLLDWRVKLSEPEFLQAWEENLAFKGQWVQVISPGIDATPKIGKIIALMDDGALQIQEESGKFLNLRFGEMHPSDPPLDGFLLRPVDRPEK